MALIQIVKFKNDGWYFQAYDRDKSWFAKGPFKTKKEAIKHIWKYAKSIGFKKYDIIKGVAGFTL